MPVILRFDTLEGSMADIGSAGSIVTRGGFAHYEPFSDQPTDHAGVIADIYNRIRSSGERGTLFGSRHPRFSNLALTRIPITPVGAGQFRFQLVYELLTVGSFGAQSAYIIEESTVLQAYTTTFMPWTREPIRVGFYGNQTNPGNQGGNTRNPKRSPGKGNSPEPPPPLVVIPEDFVPMNLLRPVRTRRITQVRFGRPKEDLKGVVGFVNQDQWDGLPAGYWLITEFTIRKNRYEGYYTTVAEVYTKNSEDWSEFGVLVNSLTGKRAPVSQSDINAARNAKYQPLTITKYNGMTHVFPYPWVSFRQVFGF